MGGSGGIGRVRALPYRLAFKLVELSSEEFVSEAPFSDSLTGVLPCPSVDDDDWLACRSDGCSCETIAADPVDAER